MTATGEELRAFPLGAPLMQDLDQILSQPKAHELVVELAHDMRAPLGAILVLTELLESGRSGRLDAEQERQVRLIRSAVQSLAAVTDDVMELARNGADPGAAAPSSCVVRDVLATVVDIARPMAAVKGLELRMECEVVQARIGHARALERVLLNLVTNAIKFTDHGVVELLARAPDARCPEVRFSVRDTGRGISHRALQVLMEPLPAAGVPRPRGLSSAGLGLLVCRRLVTAMGGALALDSRVQHGSRFHFTLALPHADP